MAVATVPREGTTDGKLAGLMDAAGAQVDELQDDGTQPTPPTPSEPTAPAEPPSAPPAEPAGEPPSPVEPSATAPVQKPSEQFMAKHAADPEKGYQHYFDVQTQNARLAREKAELERRLQAVEQQQRQPQQPAAPPAPAEPSPEVAELDAQIRDLSVSFDLVERTLANAQQQYAGWTQALNSHLDSLDRSTVDTTINVAEVQSQIRSARQQISGWERVINDGARQRANVINEYRNASRWKKHWERMDSFERSRVEDDDQAFNEEVSSFRKEWDTTVQQTTVAKIPEKYRERFTSWAEKMGKAYVHTIDQATGGYQEISDTKAFVDGLAQEYLDWLRDASSGYVQAKVASTQVAAPVGKNAVVPAQPAPKKPSSLEELSAHHDDLWAKERI